MKKKIIYVLFALAVIGCNKDDIARYDMAQGRICFPGANKTELTEYPGYSTSDSIFYASMSFKKLPEGTTTGILEVPVKLIGGATDIDREIAFRIVSDASTADPATYKIVSSKVPAGQTYGAIQLEVTKDAYLDAQQRSIDIELIDSPDLSIGLSIYLKANLSWHNMLLRPTLGGVCTTYNQFIDSPLSASSTALDAYSQAAHQLLLDAFEWEDIPVWSTTYSYYTDAYRAKANAYYTEWKAANPGKKIIHETGVLKGQEVAIRLK